MTFCKEFSDLDHYDQDLLLSMLIHVVRVDSSAFKIANDVIELGKIKGHYDKVKFGIDALKDLPKDQIVD